jgi:hypothetical protein
MRGRDKKGLGGTALSNLAKFSFNDRPAIARGPDVTRQKSRMEIVPKEELALSGVIFWGAKPDLMVPLRIVV